VCSIHFRSTKDNPLTDVKVKPLGTPNIPLFQLASNILAEGMKP